MNDIYLVYIGKGVGIYGVPARDLTQEEAEIHDVRRLLQSGLYKRAEKPTRERQPRTKPAEVQESEA